MGADTAIITVAMTIMEAIAAAAMAGGSSTTGNSASWCSP